MDTLLGIKILRELKKLRKLIKRVQKETFQKMDADKQALIDAFDKATTAIGDRIAKLIASQSNVLDPEFKAALEAEVSKLTALGADGSTPTP